MRCFIGIEIPTEVKGSLAKTAQGIRDVVGPGYRCVPEENFHITLKFLGDIEPPLLGLLRESLREVAQRSQHQESQPIDFTIDTLSAFPSSELARVIWAGGKPTTGLLKLAREVELVAVKYGFPEETRSFTPHVTLLKLSNRQQAVSICDRVTDPFLLSRSRIPVQQVCLFTSMTKGGSVHYKVLEAFTLVS